jgi:hypothetical protein
MAVAAQPPTVISGDITAPTVRRSNADLWMRRVLRLPLNAPAGTADGARQAFQTSMMVAAVRCVLMYLVFPFVLPAVGVAGGIGPALGLAVNTAAVVCIVMSLRRFFRADHSKRWHYAAIAGAVLVLLGYLAVVDIIDLVS